MKTTFIDPVRRPAVGLGLYDHTGGDGFDALTDCRHFSTRRRLLFYKITFFMKDVVRAVNTQ